MPPQPPHLILAGPTRTASTSLFRYLADHPQTAAASVKETRFFLRSDPHLERLHTYDEAIADRAQRLAAYDKFFVNASPDQVRIDASPDYVFDAIAAERIARDIPESRVVIVRRDPIDRLISWHRFGKQRGLLAADLSLEDYVQQMRDAGPIDPNHLAKTPQALRALYQSRLDDYLPAWQERFAVADQFDPSDQPERLLILDYDQIAADPRAIMHTLAHFAGLDPAFYDDYQFETINASYTPRHPWAVKLLRKTARTLRPLIHDKPWLHAPLRKLRRGADAKLVRREHEATDADSDGLSPEMQEWLEAFYAGRSA